MDDIYRTYMTDKLTIKDLNCGNCPLHSVKAHPIRCYGDIQLCDGKRVNDMMPLTTRERGCASHPLALQILTAPVIEELERLRDEISPVYNEGRTGINITDAIKFLKEGVKK
jgi:hypothetical protein